MAAARRETTGNLPGYFQSVCNRESKVSFWGGVTLQTWILGDQLKVRMDRIRSLRNCATVDNDNFAIHKRVAITHHERRILS